MAGYYRIAVGLTAVLIGVAVARARVLPRWTAAPALLSGVAFVTDGVNVSYQGFIGANPANLISLASFVLFAVAATVAAWWPPADRSGGTGVAAETQCRPQSPGAASCGAAPTHRAVQAAVSVLRAIAASGTGGLPLARGPTPPGMS